MNNFFTENDISELIYFQVPKVLILSDKYKKLKPNALKLYIVLLDRMKLSLQNGWKNAKGQYYVRMNQELASDLFGWSKTTFVSMKKELEAFDLLVQEREGQGKSNKLFIKKCEFEEEDIFKINRVVDESLEKDENQAEEIDKQNKEKFEKNSPENEVKVKESQDKNNEKSDLVKVSQSQQKKSQNSVVEQKDKSWPLVDMTEKDKSWYSRRTKVGILEGQKLASNNNKYNNNKYNNNNSEKPVNNVNNVNNSNKKNFDKILFELKEKYLAEGMNSLLIDKVIDEALDNMIGKEIYDDEAYIDKCLNTAFTRSLINSGVLQQPKLGPNFRPF